MLATVKLKQNEKNPRLHSLTVNGVEFGNCTTRVCVEIDATAIPQVTIELNALDPEFEGKAEVQFEFTPKSVMDSIRILRNELQKHEIIYYGFLASIESSLRQKKGLIILDNEKELAEDVLNAIIGEKQVDE